MAFDSFTRAFNQLNDDLYIPLDRRLFERVFIIYELIRFQLFMGTGEKFLNECSAFLPRNIYTDIDKFIMINYDHFYKTFVQFWSTHNTFYPCTLTSQGGNDNSLCCAAIICDGHMKIRRRLCANSNVPLSFPIHFTGVFKELIVGCSHTPNVNEKLCRLCKSNGVEVESSKSRNTTKQIKKLNQKLKNLEKRNINDMGTVRKKNNFVCELSI